MQMLSPLTRTANVARLAFVSTSDVVARWYDDLQIELDAAFKDIGQLEYWQCLDTGLCWYEPIEAAGSSELYGKLELLDWYYMAEKWEFKAARELLYPSQEVLEIGAGLGYFLEFCRTRGIEVQGIELNPSAAMRARNKGFRVYQETLEQLADRVGDESYDVICSFQVLEHVPKPKEFIEGMLRNLRVGGRLLLSVPNAAVMRRIDPHRSDLLNQPPHHMSHWDADVFKALEAHLPLRVRSVHREPLASYHVEWISIGFLRSCFSFLGGATTNILFNRYSLYPLCQALRLGLRNWLPGHSLLVELEKTG